MSTTRTDVHSVNNLEPESYRYTVAVSFANEFDFVMDEHGNLVPATNREYEVTVPTIDGGWTCVFIFAKSFEMAQAMAWADVVRATSSSPWAGSIACHHCGARIVYAVVMEHVETGEYIFVGEQCANGRFQYSNADMDRLREKSATARKEQRILTAWNEYKTAQTGVDWDALYASTNDFVMSVLSSGRNKGELTERQLSAIVTAVARDAERAKTEAERNAERERAVAEGSIIPAPSGRTHVVGTVLSTKWQDSDFGYGSLKMLVLADAGYKVWSTVPSSIVVDAGDKVEFHAELTPSNNDAYFAFAKRPTKARVL